MPRTATIACPHCGLRLVISHDAAGRTIEYDMLQWEKLCKLQELTSPELCLLHGKVRGLSYEVPDG